MAKGFGACCIGCQERHEACHDTCPTYQSARAEYQEWRRKVNQAKKQEKLIYEYKVECIIKRKPRSLFGDKFK